MLALSLSAALFADPLDTLCLSPVSVRPILPRASGSCFTGLTDTTLATRMTSAFDSARFLRRDTTSSALLRLRMDTADGLCDVMLDFQDDIGRASARVTLAPGQSLNASDALARLVRQVSDAIAKDRSGVLELRTTPPGARVWLAGLDAGTTPLRLESMRLGPLPVRISMQDWLDVAETLSVQPGPAAVLERALVRTPAWLDSVRRAAIVFRRDSLWNDARTRPAKDLAELFDRLAIPVVPGARLSVAILPFDTLGAQNGTYNPGVMAAEYGIARWSGDARFVVVERADVGKLLREQAFAQSGAVSDSGAAEMGRLAAARYLVTGTVQVANGKQVFTARMVSVETGELVSAAVAEKGSGEVDSLYREALGEKGQLSASLYRSLAGPGWGQFYTNHPVHGGIALGAVVASIGFATWAYLDYADKDDELQKYRKHDPATLRDGETSDQWIARAEAVRSDRNDAATMFGLSLGVVGVAWVGNVIDAGILGYMESQRIKAKYFAYIPTPVATFDGLALAWRF